MCNILYYASLIFDSDLIALFSQQFSLIQDMNYFNEVIINCYLQLLIYFDMRVGDSVNTPSSVTVHES